MRQNLFALCLVWGLTACSMSEDTRIVEQEIPKFHAALDASKFESLYDDGAQDLKAAATKQDFVRLIDAVHRKLGNVVKSEKTSWNVNYDTSGTFVTLVYATDFARGPATAQFVYRLENNHPLLAGYHINSNALITN